MSFPFALVDLGSQVELRIPEESSESVCFLFRDVGVLQDVLLRCLGNRFNGTNGLTQLDIATTRDQTNWYCSFIGKYKMT